MALELEPKDIAHLKDFVCRGESLPRGISSIKRRVCTAKMDN